MVSVVKDPITFDELMATLIDFSKYTMNRLKIDNLTQAHLVGPNNPEVDRCPFDLTKPLPLKGHPGRLTVTAEYFFNNDLEFIKSSDPEKKYTTSITKTKAARYEIVGIKDMVLTLWSTTKVGYDKDALKGIKHWRDKRQHWYRSQDYRRKCEAAEAAYEAKRKKELWMLECRELEFLMIDSSSLTPEKRVIIESKQAETMRKYPNA
ncbi:hypothetical protein Tco_0610424 [Tanacetum coccineum]